MFPDEVRDRYLIDLDRRVQRQETGREVPLSSMIYYGDDSTIVGFSAITTRNIYYRVVDDFLFFLASILGTSNDARFSFTLPYANVHPISWVNAAQVRDNGVTQQYFGRTRVEASNNIVQVGKLANADSAFTASGEKAVLNAYGFYEISL